MKHITQFLCENPKFVKDFKFWILRNKKKETVKSFDGEFVQKYGCWEGFLKFERTIVFFEWSDINGQKRYFSNTREFYKFLEESKITYPDYNMRKLIEENDLNYMACAPGKATLIHATSKDNLAAALEKLKSQPIPTSPHTMPKTY